MNVSIDKLNAINIKEDGLFVAIGANLRTNNSSTIQHTLIGGTLFSDVKVNDLSVHNILRSTSGGLEVIPNVKNVIPKINDKDNFSFYYNLETGNLNLKTFTGSLAGLVPEFLGGEKVLYFTSTGKWESIPNESQYYQTFEIKDSFVVNKPDTHRCQIENIKLLVKSKPQTEKVIIKKNNISITEYKLNSQTKIGVYNFEVEPIELNDNEIFSLDILDRAILLKFDVFITLKFF